MIGSSRRQPGVGRRDNIGQPRSPHSDDSQGVTPPPGDEAVRDPITQGFAEVMARFNTLETRLDVTDRRVENLEVPVVLEPDQPYDDYDEDAREYSRYRGFPQRTRDQPQRNQQLGFRDRGAEFRPRCAAYGDIFCIVTVSAVRAATHTTSRWETETDRLTVLHRGSHEPLRVGTHRLCDSNNVAISGNRLVGTRRINTACFSIQGLSSSVGLR